MDCSHQSQYQQELSPTRENLQQSQVIELKK
jgi:hypothetical protein